MPTGFSAHLEEWPLKQPFRIAGVEWQSSRCLVIELSANGCIGRGEAQGVFYRNETADSIYAEAIAIAAEIRRGLSRQQLQAAMPPGGARNAIDCAMWDLECRQQGKSIWDLTGIEPAPVTTVFTIGMESTPEAMAAKAAAAVDVPILKIKLDQDRPIEKLDAIRAARPDAKLVVDANQGWDLALLRLVLSECTRLGIEMIEQPLPRGGDAGLEGLHSPVTLAADESCLHTGELEQAAGRYTMINIKLDKTGGLTGALALATAAREKNYQLMVGNMTGTSLSMAPAFVIAQLCDFVDIDGPLLLQQDHVNGLRYTNAVVDVFEPALWGGGSG